MLVIWKDILAHTTFQLPGGKKHNGYPYEKRQNYPLRGTCSVETGVSALVLATQDDVRVKRKG